MSTMMKMAILCLFLYSISDWWYHGCDISVWILCPSWINGFKVESVLSFFPLFFMRNTRVKIIGAIRGKLSSKFQLRVRKPAVCSHCVYSVGPGFTREIYQSRKIETKSDFCSFTLPNLFFYYNTMLWFK